MEAIIKAYSHQNQILVELPAGQYRIERRYGCDGNDGPWNVLTDTGYVPDGDGVVPVPVMGNYLDKNLPKGICQYKIQNFSDDNSEWKYTGWLRCGSVEPVGVTFGNYEAPEGSWGVLLTPDDIRYTYLWGVDFRASNGASYTDAQIEFFINAAQKEIERILKITITKTRIASEPARRGLKKGVDYDEAESYYTYKRERIQRTGMIHTRKRPIVSVSRCDLLTRTTTILPLLATSRIDNTKGRIEFFTRPHRIDDSMRAVETAIYPHGAETLERNFCYSIDYIAGFETCEDVPMDLRQIVGKVAAVSLLNIIGRGLMSGFSSSSLSMDGVSESFSSTQSATSAYYGADVKEYNSDIDKYLAENKMRFGHIVMGAL
jgi:hypothetical protein